MQLSEHFSLEEMTRSDSYTRLGKVNNASPYAINNLTELCKNILEPLRAAMGKPIIIRSGFRCEGLNYLVGGAQDSQHLYGQAADITINGVSNDVVWNYIKDMLPFNQVIAEHLSATNGAKGWVHVSYASTMRKDAISCVHGEYSPGLHYEG